MTLGTNGVKVVYSAKVRRRDVAHQLVTKHAVVLPSRGRAACMCVCALVLSHERDAGEAVKVTSKRCCTFTELQHASIEGACSLQVMHRDGEMEGLQCRGSTCESACVHSEDR